jgi:glutamate synthase (ferredoxin)
MLVAVGCDMARQCHLDTCPTGIATQREDLRAKFAGTPEQVERFALALAEDLRRELAALGATSVGEVVGEGRRFLAARSAITHELGPVLRMPSWTSASGERRSDAAAAAAEVRYAAASPLEERLVAALRGQSAIEATGLRVTTADRSFGAALSGAIERGELRAPIRIEAHGSAGQSFGAFATSGLNLRLVGQANDYVGKGLSGGRVVIVPESELGVAASSASIAGNTCLYGATGGRLHLVGRAGMRFAVRNSGAEAVVEGVGPHGCEYMTGGVVVILGPVGANLGAGMTGGRAYLYDPPGRHAAGLHGPSVRARRLAEMLASDPIGRDLLAEFRHLVEDHAAVGSELAARVLDSPTLADDVWLVEPIAAAVPAAERPISTVAPTGVGTAAARAAS